MAIPPISQNWIQYKGVTVERFHSQPSKLIEQIKIFTLEKELNSHRTSLGHWPATTTWPLIIVWRHQYGCLGVM